MVIIQLVILLGTIVAVYFAICFSIFLFLANFPRNPINERPDWGKTEEYRVPTLNGKTLECWVVYPEKLKDETRENALKQNPAVLLVHGWGRNRGRMVSRARIYGKHGYTTILPSARDHGNSDKELTGMSILRFSQDVESCVDWWGKPVIIDGHSIGAGATLLVAARNPLVKAVIAEASPIAFPYNLKHVYRPLLKGFTPVLLPGITAITLIKFRKNTRAEYSPLAAAPEISAPTLLIQGEEEEIFPSELNLLQEKIRNCQTWIPDKTGHSNIEHHPDYEKRVIDFISNLQ